MGFLNLFAGILCGMAAIHELTRPYNTRQWQIFADVCLAGINLYFAGKYFGWL